MFLVVVLLSLSGCDLLSSNSLDVGIKPTLVAGKPPLSVQFEAVVPGTAKPPISYRWDFGDAQSDLGNPASHRYIAAGAYEVTLIVTDARGNLGKAEHVVKVVDFSRHSETLPAGIGAALSADFDQDGRPDLAVASRIRGDIALFMAQDNGDFVLSKTIGNGRNFSDLVTADFDDDGVVDLAASDLVNSVIWVFTGNGKGAFKDPFRAPIFLENFQVASGPQALAVGDFNGDGFADVATVNQATDNVSVLLGDGQGRLALAHVFKPHSIGDLVRVRAVDVDQDGLDDLVVLNQTSAQAEVFLGRGDGTFVFHLEVATGEMPEDVIVDDLDRDGYADIAVANAVGRDISLWWGRSNARFDSPGRWPTGATVNRLSASDVDGDGQLDLVALDQASGQLAVILAQGTQRTLRSVRAFERPFSFVLGAPLDSLYANDLNQDGQADLVLTEPAGEVDVLLNLTPEP